MYSAMPRAALHSFPTRRSSDPPPRARGRRAGAVGDRVRVGERAHLLLLGARADRHTRDGAPGETERADSRAADRKSTRLNSSHLGISYAVFCLKKKMVRHNKTI